MGFICLKEVISFHRLKEIDIHYIEDEVLIP
jgi:hypothetical protein